ncbi:hypothetical protein QBC44DRAFT_396949 [Cladorrhinum sp. PSN332]|nr:hypothetical protein QBC44DRAFT_396949 [Cladorrhinum sp. PSN332]
MTGYSGRSEAFVKAHDDLSLIRFNAFREVAYVIWDGTRVNLADDYVVLWEKRLITEEDHKNYGLWVKDPIVKWWGWTVHETLACEEDRDGCEIQSAVSKYVRTYGFNAVLNVTTPTVFNNTTIPGPVLNISGFHFNERYPFMEYPESGLYGYAWQDPATGEFPFRDLNNKHFAASQMRFYSTDYLKDNGICQSTDVYKWGFSYVQLFIVVIALFVWTAGISMMWLSAVWKRNELDSDSETPGRWKSVLHLARAMTEQLGETGDGTSPNNLRNRVLDWMIGEKLGGGLVSISSSDSRATKVPKGAVPGFGRLLWSWIKDHWIWSLLFGMTYLAVLVTVPLTYHLYRPRKEAGKDTFRLVLSTSVVAGLTLALFFFRLGSWIGGWPGRWGF